MPDASDLLDKADELIGSGKPEEALRLLDGVDAGEAFRSDGDRASYHFYRGQCLDRQGNAKEADREFLRASKIDPQNQPMPARMPLKEFEAVVREALESIPEPFRKRLGQSVVRVEDYPAADVVEDGLDGYILGLYSGTPRPAKIFDHADSVDFITLYKRNLEIEFPDPADLLIEIRKTVIHEVAHHFGLEDDEIDD